MAPDEDLYLENHECWPWQTKRARVQVPVIEDMNTRGFEVGHRFREDGTEFLPTGYSANNSQTDQNTLRDHGASVKAYSVSGQIDSKTNYDIPTKSYSSNTREYVSSFKSFFGSTKNDHNADYESSSITSGTRDYALSFKSFFASSENDYNSDHVSLPKTSETHDASSLKSFFAFRKNNYNLASVSPSNTFSKSNKNNDNRDDVSPRKDNGSSGNDHVSPARDYGTYVKDDLKYDYVSPAKHNSPPGKDKPDFISSSKDLGPYRIDDHKRDYVSELKDSGSSDKDDFVYVSPSNDNLASPSSVSLSLKEYLDCCNKELAKETSEVSKSPSKTNTKQRKCGQLCESDTSSATDNDESVFECN